MTRLVTDYLEETEQKYPNKIAFSSPNSSLTFHSLRENARLLAYKIHAEDPSIFKSPIAVYLEKSPEVIASFMAAAYSGNFYTPIDVSMPLERIKKIIDTLEPRVVITDAKHLESARAFSGNATLFLYDKLLETGDIETETLDNTLREIESRTIDTDILYALFTSGSTGNPKGVLINHRSCIDYAEWVSETFRITSETIFGEQAPFYFDNSILDIYQTLRNGATCHIIPEKFFMLPKALFEFLSGNQVNTIFWVPSALSIMANLKAVGTFPLPSLRRVLFCGEVMPTKQMNVWKKAFPDALFANLYGPTEITDVCAYYIIDRDFRDDEPLPIGFPCRNTRILVLNEQNKLVENGERGELCVAGTCLSLGYFNDREKTNASFVQNPLNPYYAEKIYRTGDIVHYNERGELVYDCRKDFQIKLSGHRIELGEIETVASSIDGVAENCSLFDEPKKKIVLFFTGDIEISSLKERLKEKLPPYMIPQRFLKLDLMPKNLNGKIDRVELSKRLSN